MARSSRPPVETLIFDLIVHRDVEFVLDCRTEIYGDRRLGRPALGQGTDPSGHEVRALRGTRATRRRAYIPKVRRGHRLRLRRLRLGPRRFRRQAVCFGLPAFPVDGACA